MRAKLTPDSDAVAVAKMILSAHDSADLALAAIADQLGIPGLSSRLYLLDYPSKIQEHVSSASAFPETGFLRQLNEE